MVKKIMYSWKRWWESLHTHNYFAVKLGVSILLVGLAFRFFHNRSSDFSPVTETPFLLIPPPSVFSVGTELNSDQIPLQGNDAKSEQNKEKCDIFTGDWVPYKGEPLYTNNSCSFIEQHQNCLKNGRPDRGYLHWKWKPRDCDSPQFDPVRFLDLMRNKSWALIGDSISRNHVQSLLCLLSMVEKAVEIYHDENYRSRKWIFPSHNFTLSVIWSPFLAEAAIFEDMNGVSTSEIELHLDKLDKNWTHHYKDLDYIIFSSGKWFVKSTIYYENDTILGCHYCPKRSNITELGINFAYRKVIRKVFDYIIESNNKNNGTVFYRTSTPSHFENGEWFSGGTCGRKVPAKQGEFDWNELTKILRAIELEEFAKASVKAYENGVKLMLLDVGPLSLLRPDGHPGPYRFYQPFGDDENAKVVNDCLHWCLPGPIDSWNDLLMEMIK
ncbi:hypothetical protein ABFX02_05G107400 [Erythranthe guttata]